jgi:hypothetical protein
MKKRDLNVHPPYGRVPNVRVAYRRRDAFAAMVADLRIAEKYV